MLALRALRAASYVTLSVLLASCGDRGDGVIAPETADRPELATPPTSIFVDWDQFEAEDTAVFSEICGFPVTVDWEGGFQIRDFSSNPRAKRQKLEIINYRVRGTFTNAAGESVRDNFAGTDTFYIQDGQLFVNVAGEDIGSSGLVVINLETGETVKRVGADQGGVPGAICEPLS